MSRDVGRTLCPVQGTVSPLVKPASWEPCNSPVGPHLLGSASRGFSVGILSTNSPKACQVIAESSEMDIFVVDNDRQLQKIIQVSDSRAFGSQEGMPGGGHSLGKGTDLGWEKGANERSAYHPIVTHKLGTVDSMHGQVWGL